MKRLILLTAMISLTLTSCTAEDGNSLQLGGIILPEADCAIKVSGKTTKLLSMGVFDPSGGGPYSMGVMAYNYMRATDKDKAETPDTGKANIRSYGNTLSAKSFDVCYYVKTSNADYNNAREANGRNIQASNCTNDDVTDAMFPVYYESVLASGALEPSKAALIEPGSVSTQVFSKAALREIFGADFDAEGLRDSLQVPDPEGPVLNSTKIVWGVPDPNLDSGARNPAWGEFPKQKSNNIETVVEFRLIAETQSGTEVTSNWITFPVNIAVLQFYLACNGREMFLKNCPVAGCFAGGTPTIASVTAAPCADCSVDANSGNETCTCENANGDIVPSCTPSYGPFGDEPQKGGECNLFQDINLGRTTCEPLDDPCEAE